MARKFYLIALILLAAALIQSCGKKDKDNGTGVVTRPEPRILIALKPSPGLASVDNAIWDGIDPDSIRVGDEDGYKQDIASREVYMKALRTADSLFIRAEWSDATANNRFGELRPKDALQWERDTTVTNEDRLYIMFDISGPNGADCAASCHIVGSDTLHYTDAGDEVDIWQWKANRTGLAGFADDMFLNDTAISPDSISPTNNNLLYYNNFDSTAFRQKPFYMHIDSTEYGGPGLLQGEYVVFDDNVKWYDSSALGGLGAPIQNVPGYYLDYISQASGGRWNVRSVQNHDGSGWTIVMARALASSDPTDIDFTSIPVGDSVQISIAITNNSGVRHAGAKPFYMIFQ
jgi:hypothetical protein